MKGCLWMFSLLELWGQRAFESNLPLCVHLSEFSGQVAVREVRVCVLSLYIQG